MKTLLFLLSFFVTMSTSQAQDSSRRADGKPRILRDAETVKRIRQLKDSVLEQLSHPDTAIIREQISKNTDAVLEFQKEQRSRERRGAFIRIAIGVGLLIVLIFGFLRRKKPK